MPNHCFNTLHLNEDSLSLIVEKYIRKNERGDKLFDFDLIVPIGNVIDFTEQRLEKWGTKWVGYDLCIGESTIEFFTAWSPPIPIIKKLAELHNDHVFRLEYYETGISFRGIYTSRVGKEGVIVEDKSWIMTDKDYIELGLV